MIIEGAAYVPLQVGDRIVKSEILITADLNGLIIGVDFWRREEDLFGTFTKDKSSSQTETG